MAGVTCFVGESAPLPAVGVFGVMWPCLHVCERVQGMVQHMPGGGLAFHHRTWTAKLTEQCVTYQGGLAAACRCGLPRTVVPSS